MKQIYVGTRDGKRRVFVSATTLTEQTHKQYHAVIGPFLTRSAAFLLAAEPRLHAVADAEKQAAKNRCRSLDDARQ
jgi:hypothetical protein